MSATPEELCSGTDGGFSYAISHLRRVGANRGAVQESSVFYALAPTLGRAEALIDNPVPNRPDGDTFIDVMYFRGTQLRDAVPKVLGALDGFRTRPPGSLYLEGDRRKGGATYRCAMCGRVETLKKDDLGHVERDDAEAETVRARAYHARWERLERRFREGEVPVYGLALTTLQVWGRSLVKHDPDGWWIGAEDLADLLAFRDMGDAPTTAKLLALGASYVAIVRAGDRLIEAVRAERQGMTPDLRYVLGEECAR